MKKKKKKRNWDIINNIKDKILNNTNKIWIPNPDSYKNICSDSWYNIDYYNSGINNPIDFKNIYIPVSNKPRCAIKVNLILNNFQKIILNNWFNAYIIMYNITIKYIKNLLVNDYTKEDLDFSMIRMVLKEYKNDIINGSQIKYINKDTKIRSHMLDGAIKLAITNYKSALTNLENGNIKKFRIRYWKHKKDTKILNIEQSFINKNSNGITVLGFINAFYDNKFFNINRDNIKCDSIIKYDGKTDEYYLFVPIKIDIAKKNNNPNNYISLDPGLRVFMTGMSNKEILQIGKNVNKEIGTYIKRIDNLNKIPNKQKRYNKERLYNRKIVNKVDDLHWKSINYLTNKYSTILIGDMSVQGIVSNDSSILNNLNKKIAHRLKFYKYRMRLKYKCMVNKVKYRIVNESYTSKMCSQCGWLNEKLGGNKIFKCENCYLIIDRDINGCRNMIIKSL